MQINTIGRSKLPRHDTPGSIVDENIDSVSLFGNFVCDLGSLFPIREIALDPDEAFGGFLAKLFCDGCDGFVGFFFAGGCDLGMTMFVTRITPARR